MGHDPYPYPRKESSFLPGPELSRQLKRGECTHPSIQPSFDQTFNIGIGIDCRPSTVPSIGDKGGSRDEALPRGLLLTNSDPHSSHSLGTRCALDAVLSTLPVYSVLLFCTPLKKLWLGEVKWILKGYPTRKEATELGFKPRTVWYQRPRHIFNKHYA